jgi:serine/threonine protein phosphatase PrpC
VTVAYRESFYRTRLCIPLLLSKLKSAALSTTEILSQQRIYHLPNGSAYGLTDVGAVRSTNEDNFLIDAELGLVMLCDGMGGHDGGEVASANTLLAVQEYLRQALSASSSLNVSAFFTNTRHIDPDATQPNMALPAVALVAAAVEHANAQLYTQNQATHSEDGNGMGTTLTGFWQPGPQAPCTIFHVGDSRLYCYRDGEFSQITRDHTLYQQALDLGATANLPPRNIVLQAVGPDTLVQPDIHAYEVKTGDLLLLCSDGLHGSVPHAEMRDVVAGATPDTFGDCCARLVALAKEYGGNDNITVVLALIE